MTTFDPSFFPGGDAFWLHGVKYSQETVFVIAARLFTLQNLNEELVSLRIFYNEPVARNDTCTVECVPAGVVFKMDAPGNSDLRVAHTGNLWVAPAFRGQGIPAIATRALHREILRRWPEAQWIWGLQEKELCYKGLWQDQGYPHCEGQVIWDHNPYARRFDMKVVYGSREEIIVGLSV